jgi:hypothetical protein
MAENEDGSEHEGKSVSDATVARVAKSVVDIGLPGFSLYVDGDFSEGVVHTVAGLGASILLGGPLGMWLAAADSIARSSKGKHLWQLGQSDSEHRQPRQRQPRKEPSA